MSEMLGRLKSFFETEEGKKSIKDYFSEIDERNQKEISYFNSDKFNETLDTIRDWMFHCESFFIKDDDFSYNLLKLPITESEYFLVINSILKSLNEFEKEDESIPFGNGFVYHNEWKVSYMVGQGTVHKLELCLDRFKQIERDKKISLLNIG